MILYVNIAAYRDGDGSKERPYRSINDAAKIAQPGDEIIVAPGVYHEYVNPIFGGTKEAPIVYRSEQPLGAEITGAEDLTGWELYQGTTWTARVNNGIFGSYNPFTTEVFGDWYFAPTVRHTAAVYLNDRALYETETLEECLEGKIYSPSWEPEYSIYKWFAVQDGDETILYANFQDKDPNKEHVEINVRRNCFIPDKTGVNYITFCGFKVSKAATTWAPPAAYQDGMSRPHSSKGSVIEDCELSNSKCCGISLGKYYDPENDHYFTRKHLKSATQMERDAVCRGQYHGWLKENVGHHIVRRCHIHHCEQAGIVGRMGCVFSTIEDCHIHHINNMQQLGGAEISAIKLHAAIDVTIRRNHFHHSTMGVWLDWQAQGARITQNLFHHNYRPDGCTWADGGMGSQDIFIEVGHGPTLVDNNILLSKDALRIATEGVACVHNLFLGGFTTVGLGTDNVVNGRTNARYTPYHIPHRTEVAGFMTILHGDNRFYNNIFVQNWAPFDEEHPPRDTDIWTKETGIVGTGVWDEYPTYDEWIANFDLDNPRPDMGKLEVFHFGHLPVWSDGNAYFKGATVWKNEKNYFASKDSNITIELKEENGRYVLHTNLYDQLKDFHTGIINSDILGYAFEPDQRFENPDGTEIVFDRDYFGEKRGISTIPGPFADATELAKHVW